MSGPGPRLTPPGDRCSHVLERLVDDPEAGETDPTLAAHLGSCLDCFRVLTELRDAGRITELMRSATDEVPDMGPTFWSALAARTVDAIEAAVPYAPARAAHPGRRRAWVRDLARRSGAVLVGATAAAMVIGLLGGWPARAPRRAAEVERVAAVGVLDEIGGGGDSFDEAGAAGDVQALEEPELRRLLDGLRRGEPEEVDEIDGWYGAASEDEAGFADQISGLDGPALRRLARALGGSTL